MTTALALTLALSLATPAAPSAQAAQPPAQAAREPAPAASPSAPAAQPPASPAPGPAPAVPLRSGETMSFDVEWGGLKLGEARLSVGERIGSILPVTLEARTTGVMGIVTLRQHMISNLDVATGLPRSSRIEGIEPSYRHVDTAQFDRDANVATVREVGKHDNTYRVEVPPGTLDFVALVFLLRTLPLEPGAVHEFAVLSGRDLARGRATVEGRETVETFAGAVAAWKVRVPTGLQGKFSEKSPTYVWFRDDARRSVVRISTHFAVGRGVAVLTAYQPGRE